MFIKKIECFSLRREPAPNRSYPIR